MFFKSVNNLQSYR